MSRIYDALKEAQRRPRLHRAGDDRRHSPRLVMDLPLFVYGHGDDRKPFHEVTRTVQINAGGGMLQLAANVRIGQQLLLTNPRTQHVQRCHVLRVGEPHSEGAQVIVAFESPSSEFWAVPFPKI